MYRYNKKFFDYIDNQSFESAKIILNEVRKLINFNSVIDVGCGTGSWLRAAHTLSEKINSIGIDGEYAKNTFKCKEAQFISFDLEQNFENKINYKSDLVICMEVAEHLKPDRSTTFIENLCNFSDIILFGAAVKHQRGTLHINEQPQSYWIDKFKKNNYSPYYLPRKKLWTNDKIINTPYYVSNSFLFVRDGNTSLEKLLKFKVRDDDVVDIVHPVYLDWLQDKNSPFRTHLYYFLPSLYKAIKRRFLMLIKL